MNFFQIKKYLHFPEIELFQPITLTQLQNGLFDHVELNKKEVEHYYFNFTLCRSHKVSFIVQLATTYTYMSRDNDVLPHFETWTSSNGVFIRLNLFFKNSIKKHPGIPVTYF